jgi:hypothetical protein
MIREAKNGYSRYWASPKFQQEIVSTWIMEQTWKDNTKPVVQLFLHGPTDFAKFTKAIQYQISKYTHPHKVPESCRINGLHVIFTNQNHHHHHHHHHNTNNNHTTTRRTTSPQHCDHGGVGTTTTNNSYHPLIQKMDLIYTFEIITLEHSVYVAELVHSQTTTRCGLPTKPDKSPPGPSLAGATATAVPKNDNDNEYTSRDTTSLERRMVLPPPAVAAATTVAAAQSTTHHKTATLQLQPTQPDIPSTRNDVVLASSLEDPWLPFDNLPNLDEDWNDNDYLEAFLALINDE